MNTGRRDARGVPDGRTATSGLFLPTLYLFRRNNMSKKLPRGGGEVDRPRSFDPKRRLFDPPKHPSLRNARTNPRGVRHIDETAQDQLAVSDRPRYQAAEGRRARMIAAAAAARRRLRSLPWSRSALPGSSPHDANA